MAPTGPWVHCVKMPAGCVASASGSASTGVTEGGGGGAATATATGVAGGLAGAAQPASSSTPQLRTKVDLRKIEENMELGNGAWAMEVRRSVAA